MSEARDPPSVGRRRFPTHLFVYGSLRRGGDAPARRLLERAARPVGPAWMAGRLWNLGAYPGLTADPDPRERVIGELYRLDDPGPVLERLDAYEGHDPHASAPRSFQRVRRAVVLEGGEPVEAWVYAWRGATRAADPVPGGDWLPNRTPRLLLVRHSRPAIEPGVPASRWRLSAEGRDRAARLAGPLGDHAPGLLVASVEPKAGETADILARELSIPWKEAPGLEEHHRATVPFFHRPGEYERRVRRLFERPSERVLGEESAAEAADRFASALTDVLRAHPAATVAVVAHGTVIALIAGRGPGVDPFALWGRLELPSFLALSRPEWRPIGEVVGLDG